MINVIRKGHSKKSVVFTDNRTNRFVTVAPVRTVVVQCGLVGESGQDGLMSESQVTAVIDGFINSIPEEDGIKIVSGRVSVTIEELPSI